MEDGADARAIAELVDMLLFAFADHLAGFSPEQYAEKNTAIDQFFSLDYDTDVEFWSTLVVCANQFLEHDDIDAFRGALVGLGKKIPRNRLDSWLFWDATEDEATTFFETVDYYLDRTEFDVYTKYDHFDEEAFYDRAFVAMHVIAQGRGVFRSMQAEATACLARALCMKTAADKEVAALKRAAAPAQNAFAVISAATQNGTRGTRRQLALYEKRRLAAAEADHDYDKITQESRAAVRVMKMINAEIAKRIPK